MMFGVPAAALAIVRNAKPEKKKAAAGMLVSSAICAFVCGVTEPFEFSFMFLSPLLYFAYAVLYGIIAFVTVLSGFRAGFSFSAGFTDLVFSASLPAAARTWLILPLGALAFVVFYAVFSFMIKHWNLKTPGREDEESAAAGAEFSDSGSGAPDATAGKAVSSRPGDKYAAMAQTILKGLGGADNLVSIDNCITRLRLEIADMEKVDEGVIRSSGAPGLIRTGKNSLQIVIGTTVQFVADELKALCAAREAVSPPQETSSVSEEKQLPAAGERVPMEEIPDPVFSGGIMGECYGIRPVDGKIYAPISGTVATVAETKHAVSISGDKEEILIHAGLDTVKLNGEGFLVHVREGDRVEQGQLILEEDPGLIRERGFDPMIIVVKVE